MVARPYGAAALNALHQDDLEWIRRATSKLFIYYVVLALATGALRISLGPWMVEAPYGEGFRLPRVLFIGHCCFFVLAGWRDMGRYVMIGLGKLNRAVWPIVAGLILGLFWAYPGFIGMD